MQGVLRTSILKEPLNKNHLEISHFQTTTTKLSILHVGVYNFDFICLCNVRHKRSTCYKQCKKEHVIEHMRTSHHSVHDPK